MKQPITTPKRSQGRALLVLGMAALIASLWSFIHVPANLAQAGERDHEIARRALQDGKVLPLRTVLEQVERDYKGQVLEVEFEHDDGRFVYEIRLLQTEGRMMKLKVDATDGKVLSMKQRGRH